MLVGPKNWYTLSQNAMYGLKKVHYVIAVQNDHNSKEDIHKQYEYALLIDKFAQDISCFNKNDTKQIGEIRM